MRNQWKLVAMALVAIGVAAGCGGDDSGSGGAESDRIEGRVEIDGSSTVAPLTVFAAEEFQIVNHGARITVGISGTGGGFERFCRGETDLSNASRPIREEEAAECASNGIEFVEFQVATDALTVVVHPENDWVDCLTVDQLATIWAPESEGEIDNWVQVDPGFPDEKLTLAGPGTDSGTFDYFTEVVNGAGGASRADYTASEDDNVVVQSVEGTVGATGYFGFSYFAANPNVLKAISIDGGAGCVAPSIETALSGEYAPLSRPLLLYASVESLQTRVVQEFMRFYLENEPELAETTLYVPLSEAQLEAGFATLEEALS